MATKLTKPDELTDKRKKLAKAIEALEGNFTGRARYEDGEFARSQLNAVLYKEDMSKPLKISDKKKDENFKTTTRLLNKLAEEDGYLRKTQQGGQTAFVIDTGANADAGDKVTGVTPSDLSDLARQVFDRHGVSGGLSGIDFRDWGDVMSKVNQRVGKRVLMIKSEPNLYELRDEARKAIRKSL